MTASVRRRALAAATALLGVLAAGGTAHAAAPPPDASPGTVVAAAPLDHRLWIPGTTADAYRLTYVTTDGHGRPALSTGEVFLPAGTAPPGGWPVISWAHGTSGLGDGCAPSVMGPAEPERDFSYLHNWMREGYAVVASDYAGLGTDGLPAYLHGRSEAHNIVDMVKAGRAFARERLSPDRGLSNRWVAIGQSQGGGAAIYTARYATEFGGSDLRYLGAVGTGTPAYIEDYVSLLGPDVPPVAAVPAGLVSYLAYIVASLRDVHPELGIDAILTPTGRRWIARAETECVFAFEKDLEGVNIGDFFTRPLASLPNWTRTIDAYMAMPESGFDKPFFMGHGLRDLDVPFPPTAAYVAKLEANRQPVTFKTYPTDHSGALLASQADSHPFVRALFSAAGPASPEEEAAATTRLVLGATPTLGCALRRGLRVRVTGVTGPGIAVVARLAGRRVAAGRGAASTTGRATVTLRFTREARQRLAGRRRVTLRLRAGDAARAVTLRR